MVSLPGPLIVGVAQVLPLLVVAIAGVVWLVLPRPDKVRVAIHALLTVALTAGALWVAGTLHADPRPFVVDPSHPALFAHPSDNGFPSDHTTFAVAAALVVAAVRRRTGVLLVVLGIVGGMARVAANVHHVQDIVGGVVIALAAAVFAAFVTRRFVEAARARTLTHRSVAEETSHLGA